ncbi:MAG: nitroreductase family protein [Nitrososphaerota archaeon]|nr:nitroreductase family protein [Nitrososphaerota archaeon]
MNLTPDELLTTTRAIRKRLDLSRPVERELIEECISIASHAPGAGFGQLSRFVVVTDKTKRASLAELYRKSGANLSQRARAVVTEGISSGNPGRDAMEKRTIESALYLYDHLQDVPVHVIPCILGRTDEASVPVQAAQWGSIFPAAWSFMLAGRARGLGMTFTTFHLAYEEEAASLLGIPFKDIMQAGLLPVAYMKGSVFRPAPRPPLSDLAHWNAW